MNDITHPETMVQLSRLFPNVIEPGSIHRALESNVQFTKFVQDYLEQQGHRAQEEIARGHLLASDLFWILCGLQASRVPLPEELLGLIRERVPRLYVQSGGALPALGYHKDWQNRPKIYGTFYCTSIAEMLELDLPAEWVEQTARWVLGQQALGGDEEGAFIEEDAPSVHDPRNGYWALASLRTLKESFGADVDITGAHDRLDDWVSSSFLSDPPTWSATKLRHALLVKWDGENQVQLPKAIEREVVGLLQSLRTNVGYTEYPPVVKMGYRDDDVALPAFLHSSLSVEVVSKLTGIDIDRESISRLVDTIRESGEGGGIGIPVRIKEYHMFPVETPLETTCAIILLSNYS